MVFNKYYDRALLLMLLGDKKNNEMIINFLKFMPKEMYGYICETISTNFHLTQMKCLKSITFENKNMVTTEGFVYALSGGIENGMLVIRLHRNHIEQEVIEKIELTLQPLRALYAHDDIDFGSFSYELTILGSFRKESSEMIYSKKYNMKKVLFDNVIVSSNNFKLNGKILSMYSCFEEISLESLFNDARFNSYGKKRSLTNKRRGYR